MSESYKEQLKIPLTNDEIERVRSGDTVMIMLSDESPHNEIFLSRLEDEGESDE